ncbi:twin-arginine translocase TatA/TatE family subunit [Methylophilaceae bacterium]|jgi:sec-independent protein translocase protein TatA|nr:twin-arginine translocase TatA/TatE family subunit [Methylophilaceae bacterium]|tara:strand:+ start:659 stop:835 length:177 start_codon:yes stop_codon:yes gene_type:complete
MIGTTELIIILLIVLVIFGAGKLKNIGGDLGSAIKSFKEGISDKGEPKKNKKQKKQTK